jgi:hypothetical protein
LPIQKNASIYTCQEVAEHATEFLEHRLPVASTNEIWLHLESCVACSIYVQQLALVRDSLRKLPGPTMSDRMLKQLLQRLARIARESGDS